MTWWTRMIALVATLVVAGVMVRVLTRRRPHPLVRLLVLTRYSLLIGGVQLGLGALALLDFPILKSAMENVFVLDRSWHICHVTWMSLLVATTCIVTYWTTKASATFRFADYRESVEGFHTDYADDDTTRGLKPPWTKRLVRWILDPHLTGEHPWRWRWVIVAVIGLPVPLASFWHTYLDIPAARALQQHGELMTTNIAGSTLASLAMWMGLGVGVWLGIMAVAANLQETLVDQDQMAFGLFPLDASRGEQRGASLRDLEFVRSIRAWIVGTISRFGPGYAREGDGRDGDGRDRVGPGGDGPTRLLPGHGQLAVFSGIVLAAFVVSIVGWSHPEKYAHVGGYTWQKASYAFPTLQSVMTILLLALLLLSALAFFFDYWRVPIVPIVLVMSLVGWKWTGADSTYPVQKAPMAWQGFRGPLIPPPGVNGKRTLVIVTAAGGGIQASAWTTQVLSGLHERYGNDFTKSIGLISAVSGGSVGTMFYLDRRDALTGAKTAAEVDREIARIQQAGRLSSLEATAQVWAGWDLVKTIAPYLAPRQYDRGIAIEDSWKVSMRSPDATMSDWRGRLEAGEFPIVAFNATNVDTGARLVISNATFPEGENFLAPRLKDPKQFFWRGSSEDLRVTTGARLSATFPYVSPICRKETNPRSPHVADGGYVDNEGVFTALPWLGHLIGMRDGARIAFDRVIILRIMPFPASSPRKDADAGKDPGKRTRERAMPQLGWLYSVVGPLQAVMNVRTDSQVARNNLELEFVKQHLKAILKDAEQPDLEIDEVRVQFAPNGDASAPLSWKLSQAQQLRIVEAWEALVTGAASEGVTVEENALTKLDQWFLPLGR